MATKENQSQVLSVRKREDGGHGFPSPVKGPASAESQPSFRTRPGCQMPPHSELWHGGREMT